MSFNSIDRAGDCFNGFSFSKPSLVNLLESPHVGCAWPGSTSASICMGREVPVMLYDGLLAVLAREQNERIKCQTQGKSRSRVAPWPRSLASPGWQQSLPGHRVFGNV